MQLMLCIYALCFYFFFSSRRRHTRFSRDWSSDVCSSDLYYDNGATMIDSVMRAARQRLRPILMTSLAFTCGVLPLALATGAGSGAQNAVGTGVIGGMIAAMVLSIFFVPLFFVLVLGGLHIRPTPHPPKGGKDYVPEGPT